MRIQGPNSMALARDAQAPRRAGASGFHLDASDGAKPQAAAPSLRAVGGIDALVALQGMENPVERRQRAVKRGRAALDVLDELKMGLLAGTVSPGHLNRLRAMQLDLQERTGETGLDGVLSEIELRVAVEIAKLGGR